MHAHVPNGFVLGDPWLLSCARCCELRGRRLAGDDRELTKFVYAGSLSALIDFREFADIFHGLCASEQIKARLFIATHSDLPSYLLDSPFIECLPKMSPSELMELFQCMDVSVAKTSSAASFKHGVSLTKYTDYMLLGFLFWMWFPLGLFFCAKGSLVLASMAWLAASLSGLTAVVFASVVVAFSALVSGNLLLPLVLFPAYAYTLLSLWPVLSGGGLAGPVQEIGKLIGLVRHQVRYDRGMKRLDVFTLYFLGLYAVSAALLSVAHRQWAWLPLLGWSLFLVNQRFVRIADEQSLLVLNCSLIACSALAGPPPVVSLSSPFFWRSIHWPPCCLCSASARVGGMVRSMSLNRLTMA